MCCEKLIPGQSVFTVFLFYFIDCPVLLASYSMWSCLFACLESTDFLTNDISLFQSNPHKGDNRVLSANNLWRHTIESCSSLSLPPLWGWISFASSVAGQIESREHLVQRAIEFIPMVQCASYFEFLYKIGSINSAAVLMWFDWETWTPAFLKILHREWKFNHGGGQLLQGLVEDVSLAQFSWNLFRGQETLISLPFWCHLLENNNNTSTPQYMSHRK